MHDTPPPPAHAPHQPHPPASTTPLTADAPYPRPQPKRWRKGALWLVVAGMAVLACWGLLRRWAPPVVRQVVAVDEQLVQAERMAYELNGAKNGWVRLDVQSDQRIDMGSYSKSAQGVLRNRLFVNLKTGEHRSLFPSQQQLLMPLQELGQALPEDMEVGAEGEHATQGPQHGAHHGADARHREVPLATLYQVVRTDTNGDGRLSTQDLAQLYLTRADGRDGVWLLTPQPVHAVDALRVGDWLLLLDASTPANPVLARFNLNAWQLASAWPLPALASTTGQAQPN